MKRCVNPECRSTYLFHSTETVCPFCHQPLAESGQAGTARPVVPADMLAAESMPGPGRAEQLVQRRTRWIPLVGSRIQCRGRVTEIDHQELFTDGRHKLLHTLFRGEPYQLSMQSVEYTIRVENLADGLPTEVTDFCLYGNYLGRLQVGDQVTVKARECRDRRVVQSIRNETTGSEIRPGLQIPAGLLRGVLLTVLLLVVCGICQLVWQFQVGAAAALSAALVPLLILGIGLYLLIRSIFPRRGRRRR